MSLFYFDEVWYKFHLIYIEISHILIYGSKIENVVVGWYNIYARKKCRRKFLMANHIEILGYDNELNTIFVRGVSGSVTLDIIPDSLNYLKSYPAVDRLYMQDYTGVEIVMNQDSTIESACEDWIRAVDLKRGTMPFPRKAQNPPPVDGPSVMI